MKRTTEGAGPATGSRPSTRTVRPAPPLWLLRILLAPLDRLFAFAGARYKLFMGLVTFGPPETLAALARWRAVRAAGHARHRVPAYGRFLAEHCTTDRELRTMKLPETDKDGYIKRFSLEQRCVDGVILGRQVAIDESSGTTGTPYNWIRSLGERRTSHIFMSHFARYCFGDGPIITINAFSMGAWATGVNMGIALQANGIVKNTGPDLTKIFSTLQFLGTRYSYLVCGYPPFLKHLIDVARERGFPLDDYRLMALVGGEGMSEGLRDYLAKEFSPVYSGYGVTDLEIGIAGETPLSVAIRGEARRDQRLRDALFGRDSRLPMLFQFNPLNHYVTVNDEGELVFTITRLELLSPRIAYNVHDEGGVATLSEIEQRFREADRDLHDLIGSSTRTIRLPFLWVYGRKDSTVSVMGANIYPEDIEQAIYDEPGLSEKTSSFCLRLEEDAEGGVRPCLCFELRSDPTDALRAEFEARITDRLQHINADFREAMKEHPAGAAPIVQLFSPGEGPFSADAGKIKQTRIVAVE